MDRDEIDRLSYAPHIRSITCQFKAMTRALSDLDAHIHAPKFRRETGCGMARMGAGSGLAYSKAMDELI